MEIIMAKKKIGILGGTFNPIHNGHLMLAKEAYEQHNLDKVWIMVSPNPPHKAGTTIVDVTHRNNMVKVAIEPYGFMELSDYEQRREGYIYTAETLTLLKKDYPENEYYFIIGGDSLENIEKWYHPEIVLANCILLAAGRDDLFNEALISRINELNEKYNADIRMVKMQPMDVSSTEIRAGDFDDIPDSVRKYIKENQLYKIADA
jgi:nicotinate-nucleotide adenylyltransferase